MNNQLLFFFIFCFLYILILILCEFLYRKGLKTEYSRKIAHIISTLSSLFFPFVFTCHWYVLLLGIISFVVLFAANKKMSFPSIDKVNRKTHGSYLLPLSICMSYYISLFYGDKTLFILPILILAISDPLAGILGKTFKSKNIGNGKTLAGTISFFLSSFILSYFILISHISTKDAMYISFITALSTSFVEYLSCKGMDNLLIPLCCIFILLIFT